jgi:hypothetical protein
MISQNSGNLNVHQQEDLKKTEYITIEPGEDFLSLQVQLHGTLIPVEVSGKMVRSGVLQAIIRDTTERKRGEK